MIGIYVYSFDDCMDACNSYNHAEVEKGATQCYGVSYDTSFSHSGRGGN